MLAVLRIKQWRQDRTHLHAGRISNYKKTGWIARRAAQFDARIVRVLDFERALATLTPHQQSILLAAYGDGERHREIARIEGVPDRTLHYQLKGARAQLANALNRRGLL